MYNFIKKLSDKEVFVRDISVWGAKPNPQQFICKKGQKMIDRLFYVVKGNFFLENKNGSKIVASKGDVLYLPADVEYVSYWNTDEEGYSISFSFILQDKSGSHLPLSDSVVLAVQDKNGELYAIFKSALDEYINNQNFAYFRLNSIFYEIFYLILNNMQRKILKNDKLTREIYEAIIYLNDNYMSDVTTEQLAKISGLSTSVFRRRFKANSGISPMKYKRKLCLKKAQQMLKSGNYTVSEISEILNCSDISHFSKLYRAEFAKNPSEDIPKN